MTAISLYKINGNNNDNDSETRNNSDWNDIYTTQLKTRGIGVRNKNVTKKQKRGNQTSKSSNPSTKQHHNCTIIILI